MLAIHSGLLAYSAYVHSPTLNEPGHLVAGLSNWKFWRFDIYSVNPPLVRMVAALPVMAAGYEEDWSSFHTGRGARPEFAMGADFVAANGERSSFLFMVARWACIPCSWIGAIACYLWARDLFGRPAGVTACAIWCFEPNILAHASLMTPDAHAAALGLAACYTFWRWLKVPTWSQAALTGVVLGLAELSKTTLILFYPLWPVMWLVYRWPDRQAMTARDWGRQAGMLVLRMAIGLYILNLGYGFEGSLKPLGEFHFVSNLFTGQAAEGNAITPPPSQAGTRGGIPPSVDPPTSGHPSPASLHNRFASSWRSVIPVPFPRNYLLGIDLQKRDFENCGRPSYLLGQWRDRGWWYYYLYAVAIKVPLGLWLLGGLTLAASLRKERINEIPFPPEAPGQVSSRPTAASRRLNVLARDKFILIFPPLLVFAVVSSQTGFSEHMRYVLPTFPFFIIWACGWLEFLQTRYNTATPHRSSALVPLFSVNLVAVCWLVTSSLSVYPHSLSYFNESIGGPLNGPKHLLGSNVDWGQDISIAIGKLSRHNVSPEEIIIDAETVYDVSKLYGTKADLSRRDSRQQLAEPRVESVVLVSANILMRQSPSHALVYEDTTAVTYALRLRSSETGKRANKSAILLRQRNQKARSDEPGSYSEERD